MERAEDLAAKWEPICLDENFNHDPGCECEKKQIAEMIRARDLELLDEVIGMCEKRARLKRAEADSLAEHYGPESDMESSMYDADAMGAEALAKQMRALREEMAK